MTKKDWQSKRTTNPLEPNYAVWDNQVGTFGKKPDFIGPLNKEYGQIAGSKPVGLKKAIGGVRNLKTDDIDGASAGSKNKKAFTLIQRRQVRPINETTDI